MKAISAQDFVLGEGKCGCRENSINVYEAKSYPISDRIGVGRTYIINEQPLPTAPPAEYLLDINASELELGEWIEDGFEYESDDFDEEDPEWRHHRFVVRDVEGSRELFHQSPHGNNQGATFKYPEQSALSGAIVFRVRGVHDWVDPDNWSTYVMQVSFINDFSIPDEEQDRGHAHFYISVEDGEASLMIESGETVGVPIGLDDWNVLAFNASAQQLKVVLNGSEVASVNMFSQWSPLIDKLGTDEVTFGCFWDTGCDISIRRVLVAEHAYDARVVAAQLMSNPHGIITVPEEV